MTVMSMLHVPTPWAVIHANAKKDTLGTDYNVKVCTSHKYNYNRLSLISISSIIIIIIVHLYKGANSIKYIFKCAINEINNVTYYLITY